MNDTGNKQSFIDRFVNSVYGILLGYGFCNAIKDISDAFDAFYAAVVILAIIVLCVHWWDWVKNIGKRVTTNLIEFTIDIAILLNLEWLFFEYDNFGRFTLLMSILAILNFIWVVIFRVQKFRVQSTPFLKYILRREVASHIVKRFAGGILFLSIYLTYNLAVANAEAYPSHRIIDWIFFAIVVLAFIFDRSILYRNRKFEITGSEITGSGLHS